MSGISGTAYCASSPEYPPDFIVLIIQLSHTMDMSPHALACLYIDSPDVSIAAIWLFEEKPHIDLLRMCNWMIPPFGYSSQERSKSYGAVQLKTNLALPSQAGHQALTKQCSETLASMLLSCIKSIFGSCNKETEMRKLSDSGI